MRLRACKEVAPHHPSMLEPGLNRMWRQPFPEVCCHLLPGLPSHPSHADNLSVQLRLNTLQQAVLPRCIPSLLNYILDLENGFCALRHLRLHPLGQRSPAGTLQSWLQAQKHLAVKNPTSAYVSLRMLSGPHLRGIVGAKGCSCSRVVESADAEVDGCVSCVLVRCQDLQAVTFSVASSRV